MISRRTVLVLGAGSSKEVGLPIGSELAKRISRLLQFEHEFGRLHSGDANFVDDLMRFLGGPEAFNKHHPVVREISAGVRLANSIDNFVDMHRHDERVARVGKAAIVYEILKAERESILFTDPMRPRESIDFERVEKTWFVQFGRLLIERVSKQDMARLFDNLTIVNFNYDRCIEEFLSHWLTAAYAIEAQQARELVAEKLKVYRPYGQVGSLQSALNPNGIPFGLDVKSNRVCRLSSEIKTYSEQVEEGELLQKVRQAIAETDAVVFLGFGFHPQNMELLTCRVPSVATRAYASAVGFSKPDCEAVTESIRRMFAGAKKADLQVRNELTCEGVFNEYRKQLAG